MVKKNTTVAPAPDGLMLESEVSAQPGTKQARLERHRTATGIAFRVVATDVMIDCPLADIDPAYTGLSSVGRWLLEDGAIRFLGDSVAGMTDPEKIEDKIRKGWYDFCEGEIPSARSASDPLTTELATLLVPVYMAHLRVNKTAARKVIGEIGVEAAFAVAMAVPLADQDATDEQKTAWIAKTWANKVAAAKARIAERAGDAMAIDLSGLAAN